MKIKNFIIIAVAAIVMTACSSTPQPEPVDLGLSVKWANFNLGATKPSEKGIPYAWGEVQTKDNFSASNSETYDVDCASLTAEKDAACQNLGESWRMPTQDEVRELIDKCTWKWSKEDKVRGYTITGPNGNSIFMPVIDESNEYDPVANYWTSTVDNDGSNEYARALRFTKDKIEATYQDRCLGFRIRPVQK